MRQTTNRHHKMKQTFYKEKQKFVQYTTHIGKLFQMYDIPMPNVHVANMEECIIQVEQLLPHKEDTQVLHEQVANEYFFNLQYKKMERFLQIAEQVKQYLRLQLPKEHHLPQDADHSSTFDITPFVQPHDSNHTRTSMVCKPTIIEPSLFILEQMQKHAFAMKQGTYTPRSVKYDHNASGGFKISKPQRDVPRHVWTIKSRDFV